ncbi:MAG: imidazole glycerol phosphate synthase subunit HisF [Flavipsychrobacter sp.]|nr:imidazole glycerol phosphate synthase subunit HisF [Flavipsychrobacter sp.]
MLTKRIIPCLDIKDGVTVKGVQFEQMRNVGDPVELGAYYADEGADELVFLDISATDEKRKTFAALVKRIAQHINIPFTVGGGISSVADVHVLLNAGADKVSINTAAIKNPSLLQSIANSFGNQCVVLAIDTKVVNGDWYVYANGGKVPTGIKTSDWVMQAVDMGVGELLITSIDNDGTKKGFAVELTRQISELTNIPVIASGGGGIAAHFADVFRDGHADAALAAGIFHNKELGIPELKQYLKDNDINIRL